MLCCAVLLRVHFLCHSVQTLTEVTSSCVVTQLLEVLLIRLGLYLLNSPAVVLDLVAYTGYK